MSTVTLVLLIAAIIACALGLFARRRAQARRDLRRRLGLPERDSFDGGFSHGL